MQTIQRILVAHDFSDTAEKALELAPALAGALEARVTILHAFESPAYVSPESIVATADLVEQIRGAAEEALADVAVRARRGRVPVDSALRQGVAWSEIEAAARTMNFDLIVMGTHGWRARFWAASPRRWFVRRRARCSRCPRPRHETHHARSRTTRTVQGAWFVTFAAVVPRRRSKPE